MIPLHHTAHSSHFTYPSHAPSSPPAPPYSPVPSGTRYVSTTAELEDELASPSYHTILVLPGLYLLTTTLTVTGNVTLRAAVAGEAVLDGQNRVQVMRINEGINVRIVGLHVTNGYASVRAKEPNR